MSAKRNCLINCLAFAAMPSCLKAVAKVWSSQNTEILLWGDSLIEVGEGTSAKKNYIDFNLLIIGVMSADTTHVHVKMTHLIQYNVLN